MSAAEPPAARSGEDPALVALLRAAEYLPREALRRAVVEPDTIAGPVLRAVAAATGDGDLDQGAADLLFWGVHALAGARDTRLYRPLMALLRQDGETLDALLGDAIETTLARVIASVFDGEAAPLHGLVLDSTVDDRIRNEALAALSHLTRAGRLPRGQTRDLLVRFDEKRVAVEGEEGWLGWEEAIAHLGLRALVPRVEAARRDGRLTGPPEDAAWFRAALRHVERDPDSLVDFDPRRYGTLDDPVAALDWTAEDAGAPLRNPFRDVGRNDPCPCGSGRKFKKCCLEKAPA